MTYQSTAGTSRNSLVGDDSRDIKLSSNNSDKVILGVCVCVCACVCVL